MNSVLLLLFFSSINLMNCEKNYLQADFKNEVTFSYHQSNEPKKQKGTTNRTSVSLTADSQGWLDSSDKQHVKAMFHAVAPKDVNLPFFGLSFDFYWTVSKDILEEEDGLLRLKKESNFKQLLKYDADNAGIWGGLDYFYDLYVGGIVSKGTFGKEGEIDIDLKKSKFFTDENGKPMVYLKGKYKQKGDIPSINSSEETYTLSGKFKLVFELKFQK